MKRIVSVFVFIFALLSLSFAVYGESEDDVNAGKRLLVVYKDTVGVQREAKDYEDGFERLPKAVKAKIKSRKNLEKLNMDIVVVDENEDIDDVIKELEDNEYIESVEEDVKREFLSIPNDSKYDLQWGLKNLNINISGAWELIERSGKGDEEVVIAVIDSGIDTDHEDLVNRIAQGGYNFAANNNYLKDLDGHGTWVSGVIAAEANNKKGISGVAGDFDIEVLPLKIDLWVSEEVEAINYAIKKDVDVINLSIGGEQYVNVENAAIQKAIGADIIVVASSGNEAREGNPIEYPASYNNVISVGSIDQYEEISVFSSYNSYVDLVAPGEMVYTTNSSGKYEYVAGTSFSSPFVAGVCGLLKTIDKSLTPEEVEDILFSTAIDKGDSGKDDYYGYGIVNAEGAVKKLLQSMDNTPPVIELIGEANISIEKGTEYVDQGATATDDIDGDISSNITVVNSVNTTKAGTYKVTYNVADFAGNEAVEATRTVVVTEDEDDEEYEEFEEKTDVETNKVWTISFNMELDEATVNTSNIYILDENNEKVSCGLSLSADGKKVIITSSNNYETGKEYSLIIGKTVSSTDNKSLTKAVKMDFTISSSN